MQDIPETPEGVALVLLKLILDSEVMFGKNASPTKDDLLRIYMECLCVATTRWREMLPHH